jgi:alpha-L-fucosidase
LNVGPQPDGRLPAGAIKGMKDLGAWLKVYGEGVYGTRICEPHFTGEWAFTRKGETVYAFRLYRNPAEPVQPELVIPYTGKAERVGMVGTEHGLAFQRTDEGLAVRLPLSASSEEAPIAHVFRITAN